MIPYILQHRKEGPLPKITYPDAPIILLNFYKTSLEIDKLAIFLEKKPSTLQNAINRIRPVLLDCLKNDWCSNPPRPRPLNDTYFPHIALLIDSTSIEVFRPKAPFSEAKIYWDTKNHMYALKKEVAVMASKPHYCIFIQKFFVGSRHDYENFKETYHTYLEYLRKKTDELVSIPEDHLNYSWSVLLDKAYIRPESATEGLRKITPKKNVNTYIDTLQNFDKNKIRVAIECFFGRTKKLWKMFREVYRWSHENFDLDFDICALLTNEHIRNNRLEEIDKNFGIQVMQIKIANQEKREKKRKLE